jgi:hypothetical protein
MLNHVKPIISLPHVLLSYLHIFSGEGSGRDGGEDREALRPPHGARDGLGLGGSYVMGDPQVTMGCNLHDFG